MKPIQQIGQVQALLDELQKLIREGGPQIEIDRIKALIQHLASIFRAWEDWTNTLKESEKRREEKILIERQEEVERLIREILELDIKEKPNLVEWVFREVPQAGVNMEDIKNSPDDSTPKPPF